MATAVFDSSGNSAAIAADWSDVNNWSGGGGTGGVPAAADDVTVVGGSVDVDTNETAFSAIAIASLRIHNEFTGKLGDVSNRITFANMTRVDFDSGGQETFLDSGVSTIIDLVVSGGVGNVNMLNVDGIITTAEILGGSGTVTFAASMALTTLRIINAPAVTVAVSTGVTGLATVQQDSGTLSVAVAVSSVVTLNGGVTTWTGTGTVAQFDVNPTSTLIYNASGTITALNMFGGNIDFKDNTATALTITAAEIHEGATLDVRNPLAGLWTWTNDITAKGGVILPPLGGTVALSGP